MADEQSGGPGVREGRHNRDRLALSVEEAAGLLGISTWLAYELVHQGELPSLRLGRRIVVPRAALERMVGVEADSTRDHGALD
ncbi:MAG TPA: helix-turn-helix domain-containing protein [Acidimicrobiales bacterium]|nr:helix-turn-helix domain-containing protein [Acidimicrobiales bacterium]